MAFQASHIRFALEVKPKFDVFDLSEYLAGTVYPDSRYPTGISREVTHPADFFTDFPKTDDFRKGWFVHLWCDQIQFGVLSCSPKFLYMASNRNGAIFG